MAKELSWTPRRRGPIYCAPACGGGCTWAAYQNAVKRAREVVAMMKTGGWQDVVHENLGWHWRIVNGPIQLHEDRDGKFWVMIGSKPSDNAGGSGYWTPTRIGRFKNPNRAVAEAIGHVRAFVQGVTETLAAAEFAGGTNGTVPPTPDIRKVTAFAVTRLCGHNEIVIRKTQFEKMPAMTATPCDNCKEDGNA